MGVEAVARGRYGSRLGALYLDHIDGATRLAYLLTGDKELAQDVAQEAFVRMAGRFQDLRNQDAFAAYLRKTILNLTRGHWRKRSYERSYLETQRGRAEPVAQQPDVESRDELWRLLQQLPKRQRFAVVLRYYEDLSEQQTADALDCSVSAVKSLVMRAMQTLRDQMQGVER